MDTNGDGPIGRQVESVLGEISAVVAAVDRTALAALSAEADKAARVFFSAGGRTGFVARAWAMRWMHLGATTHVAGDAVTPAIAADDLIVCLSATGDDSAVLAHARTAHTLGARVAVLTARPAGWVTEPADLVVHVPSASSAQTGDALFDQCCLVLGDVLCAVHRHAHAVPEWELAGRISNLR